MPKTYAYVGPPEILARSRSAPRGRSIECTDDLLAWMKSTELNSETQIVATFVIDLEGMLLIANRRSEHVACAGGQAVLSAGEMTFLFERGDVQVVEASNQSTGYCPEPESWPQVAQALDRMSIPRPSQFTQEIVFRRCPSCDQINIVKDNWLVCALCGKELPADWNVT